MKKNKKTFALVLVVIILFSYYLVYIKPDHYVDGFSSIVNKSNAENNYYIYVDNEFANHSMTKLKCTKQQYENLVIDEQLHYHIAYEYNSHSPQKGKLIIFDLSNTIDNRKVSDPAVQQEAAADFKDITTDYFTIKIPAVWKASMEVDEYSLLLNLNIETGAPAGSVQMLALESQLYPSMDSDLYKQVIHRDEKSGQTTIITVLYTDQVDKHNAAIITDIMKDSLENTAVFSKNKTTTE